MERNVKRIEKLEELAGDLANRYHSTRSTGYEHIAESVIDADFEHLMQFGFVILERILDEAYIKELRKAADPHLKSTGRNSFEGVQTQRVYDVLSKTRALDGLAEHPRILALLDKLFKPNYLLSQIQIINILPGEEAQLLHTDDYSYPLPRPRAPLGAASILAVDDFTAENGATLVVPKSHLWDDERRPKAEETIPCVMPAGSVVFFLGTLWHGGGSNRTQAGRLAATCQYCEPWLRQQENFLLEVDKNVALQLSENILRMIGYSVYPPFYGMVNGMHPKRLLKAEP